ncbi:unnamed protein product [Ostreobium quekettii]|uniref:Cytochrome P450 n=1 Tax=Ostreobium quekettii TaxID=121088 RepID=A0A8S1IQL9_9CHLO|nr:unnamed protein product [Ostreobium quekettii]
MSALAMDVPPPSLLAAAALLVAFVAGLVIRWRHRSKYDLHLIPGPPAYPIVGNLPQMITWARPQLHLKVLAWMKEHGKIMKLILPGLGGYNLYIGDPEYLQNNVSGHGANGLPKSKLYNDFRVLASPNDVDTLFTCVETNEYWKAIRKGMARAFSTTALKDVFPQALRKVLELTDIIKKKPPTEPIEVQGLFLRLTFDVVGLAGYNIDFKGLQNEHHPFLEALEYCADDALATCLNPLRKWVKWAFPLGKLAQDCNKRYSQIYDYYKLIMRELRAREQPAADDMSIWACLMRIKDPRTGAPLDDATLSMEVGTFIIGGSDTTSHQLTWVLFAIATHPEVEQRVVDELKASGVFQLVRDGAADRLIYSDVMGLSYLGMVVKEATRMFPVGPLGGSRRTTEDGVRVCGYRVPKGTLIHINSLGLNNVPWLWDSPEKFDPERWVKHETSVESEDKAHPGQKSPPRKLWSFSDGPRDCIGQRLAIMELHLAVAVLLANFELRLAERMGGWEGTLSRQYIGLVMCIDGGMWLHFDPRVDLEE